MSQERLVRAPAKRELDDGSICINFLKEFMMKFFLIHKRFLLTLWLCALVSSMNANGASTSEEDRLAAEEWLLDQEKSTDVHSGCVKPDAEDPPADASIAKNPGFSDRPETQRKRRVPPIRQKIYKVLSEAQIMIDPESVPRKEGEPAPVPKGSPTDAVRMLQKALTEKRVSGYEKAQIWNTMAFGYYVLGDISRTMNAYEQILKQSPITLVLELNALRALFQLHASEKRVKEAKKYLSIWKALGGKPDGIVRKVEEWIDTQDPCLVEI